jgi:hypothetical protein
MSGNNRHLSILTLYVNSLNAPIKGHRIANWIRKQDPTIYCLQKTLKNINTGLELKGGKKFSKQMDPINRQK